MGPSESATAHPENQEGRRRRLPCRPRRRRCLLKGCEQGYPPRQARQRYCSEDCREAARKWSRRKAQERYRETAAGQQKRNGQSRRNRERVKSRKPPEPETVNEAARAITTEHFFRPLLPPPGMLGPFPTQPANSFPPFRLKGFRAAAGPRPERERRWKQRAT